MDGMCLSMSVHRHHAAGISIDEVRDTSRQATARCTWGRFSVCCRPVSHTSPTKSALDRAFQPRCSWTSLQAAWKAYNHTAPPHRAMPHWSWVIAASALPGIILLAGSRKNKKKRTHPAHASKAQPTCPRCRQQDITLRHVWRAIACFTPDCAAGFAITVTTLYVCFRHERRSLPTTAPVLAQTTVRQKDALLRARYQVLA